MVINAWFSCGITSAVAVKIAQKRYPDAEIKIYYCLIDSAHPDNERFISDCERWYGQSIIRLKSKYADQFEVIKKRRYINGPGGAPCTGELKKNLRFEIEKQPFEAQIMGHEFDLKEINRALRLLQQYPKSKFIFPLIDEQLTKDQCAGILHKAGIELPAMYHLGYSNNNCIGCVKGGAAYWNKIRIDFPDYFDRMVQAELEIGASCINGTRLADLDPQAGRDSKPVLPDCGLICEVEFADIIDPIAQEIYTKGRQLSFL